MNNIQKQIIYILTSSFFIFKLTKHAIIDLILN